MGGISVLLLLGILSTIFWFFVAIFFIIAIYLLITYIFESVAISRINKNQKCNTTFTAWIPFYNKCILGKVADKQGLGKLLCGIDVLVFLLIIISYYATNLPAGVNTMIFFLIIVLLVLSFIFNVVLSHHIMKKVTGKFVDLLTILNVLTLGFSRSIILFIIRNQKKLK